MLRFESHKIMFFLSVVKGAHFWTPKNLAYNTGWGNLALQSYWSPSCDHGLHCSDELMWEQYIICIGIRRYVGHVVSAIEMSDLDQVLSDKRPTKLEMMSTIRCGVCWMCQTLLVSPDSAGVALGRARVVSLRGVLVSFLWSKYQNCLFVRTRSIQIIMPQNHAR